MWWTRGLGARRKSGRRPEMGASLAARRGGPIGNWPQVGPERLFDDPRHKGIDNLSHVFWMRLAAKVGQAIAFGGLPVRGAKGRRQKPAACPTLAPVTQ
jgi:hypothetical protein